MAKPVTSPDISILDFKVLLDMSLPTPVIQIINLSTVQNAANLLWVFEVKSPNGTVIHSGDFNAPDLEGVAFATFTVPEALPRIWGQLEFSNINKYSVKVSVRDSNTNVFDLTKAASICTPNGNNGKNNFGAADINIEVKCGQAQLYVTDTTNLLYKSLVGTKVSTTVEPTYPMDDAGNTFTFPATNSLPALLPVKREGEGHEIYVAHVFDYDLGDFFVVRIRYTFKRTFGVWCNITLQPLICEVMKIADELKGSCGDNEGKREKFQKLAIANTYILEAQTAILQPLSFPRYDVASRIEEVKEILGIECDCCRPLGLSSVGSVLLTDAVLTVNKVCGDMLMSWTNDGNGNIVLNYQNASYAFDISGTDAFTWQSTGDNCTKTRMLVVDMKLLAQGILTSIKNDQSVLNMLTNLVNQKLTVCSNLDGKNIINVESCKYTVQIGTKANQSIVAGIFVDGGLIEAPDNLGVDDFSGIEAWLNSLDIGVFNASYDGSTDLTTIDTENNTYPLSAIHVRTDDIIKPVRFSSNCTFICEIFQKLINYLDTISLLNIKSGIPTGSTLSVCRFKSNGEVDSSTFGEANTAYQIMEALAASVCGLVEFAKDKFLSCANIKKAFADYNVSTVPEPKAGDVVIGIFNGKCQQIPFEVLGQGIFRLLSNNAAVKDIYCQGSVCSTVSNCSPVGSLAAVPGDNSASVSWTSVVGAIGYKWSKDGINYQQISGTNVVVTGLTISTTYSVRVYPVYPSGDGKSCETFVQFNTTNTGSACVAPDNLIISNITGSTFDASWNAVTGATGYQYSLNGGTWVTIGTATSRTVAGLAPETDYTFAVRAIIGGTPCTESVSDGVTTAAIDLTVDISRSGNTLTASITGGVQPYNYTFTGSYVGDCGAFSIADPTGEITDGEFLATTTFSTTAYAGTTYKFRITVTDDNGTTVYSSEVTMAPCLVPETLITMKDGSQKMLADIAVDDELFGEGNKVTSFDKYSIEKLYIINGGLLKASPGHIHIIAGNLVQSSDLKVGDNLTSITGENVLIENIEVVDGEFEVINISTSNETYIANNILTHNKTACPEIV